MSDVTKIRFTNEIDQRIATRILECLAGLPFELQVKFLWCGATTQPTDGEPIDFVFLCCALDCQVLRSTFIQTFTRHVAEHLRDANRKQRELGSRGRNILLALELGLRFRSEGRPRQDADAINPVEHITRAECNKLFSRYRMIKFDPPLGGLVDELTRRWHLADPARLDRLHRLLKDRTGRGKSGRDLYNLLKSWGPDPDLVSTKTAA